MGLPPKPLVHAPMQRHLVSKSVESCHGGQTRCDLMRVIASCLEAEEHDGAHVLWQHGMTLRGLATHARFVRMATSAVVPKRRFSIESCMSIGPHSANSLYRASSHASSMTIFVAAFSNTISCICVASAVDTRWGWPSRASAELRAEGCLRLKCRRRGTNLLEDATDSSLRTRWRSNIVAPLVVALPPSTVAPTLVCLNDDLARSPRTAVPIKEIGR